MSRVVHNTFGHTVTLQTSDQVHLTSRGRRKNTQTWVRLALPGRPRVPRHQHVLVCLSFRLTLGTTLRDSRHLRPGRTEQADTAARPACLCAPPPDLRTSPSTRFQGGHSNKQTGTLPTPNSAAQGSHPASPRRSQPSHQGPRSPPGRSQSCSHAQETSVALC